MTKKNKLRVLSIDPGTRYLGVSILEGRRLYFSSVKTIKTKNSPRKRLEEGRRIIADLIKDFRPKVLVIERPFFFWSKQSNFLNVLVAEIESLAKREKMRVYQFSPRTVRKIVCGNGNASKEDTKIVLSTIYPKLKIYLKQVTKTQERYWSHLFDSVALGVCYLKKEGK